MVEKRIFNNIDEAKKFSQGVSELFSPGGGYEVAPEIKKDGRYAMMFEFHKAIFEKTISELLLTVEKFLREFCQMEAFEFRKNLAEAITRAPIENGERGGKVIAVDFKKGRRK